MYSVNGRTNELVMLTFSSNAFQSLTDMVTTFSNGDEVTVSMILVLVAAAAGTFSLDGGRDFDWRDSDWASASHANMETGRWKRKVTFDPLLVKPPRMFTGTITSSFSRRIPARPLNSYDDYILSPCCRSKLRSRRGLTLGRIFLQLIQFQFL